MDEGSGVSSDETAATAEVAVAEEVNAEERGGEEADVKQPLKKKKKKRVKKDAGGEEVGSALPEGQPGHGPTAVPDDVSNLSNGGMDHPPDNAPSSGAAPSLEHRSPSLPPTGPNSAPDDVTGEEPPAAPDAPQEGNAAVEGVDHAEDGAESTQGKESESIPEMPRSPPTCESLAEGGLPGTGAEAPPPSVAAPLTPPDSAPGGPPPSTDAPHSDGGHDSHPPLGPQVVMAVLAEVEALRAQLCLQGEALQQLPDREKAVDAREAKLGAQEQALRDREERQERMERNLRDRDAELAALTQQVMDRRKAVEEKELALEALAQELADLQAKEEAFALRQARHAMKEAELVRTLELAKQNDKVAEEQRALWTDRVAQLQDTEQRLANRELRIGQREQLLAGSEQWLHARDVELVAAEIDAIRHGRFTLLDGLQRSAPSAAAVASDAATKVSAPPFDAPRPGGQDLSPTSKFKQPRADTQGTGGPLEPSTGRDWGRLMESEQLVEARERHLLGLLAETERRGADLSRREKALTERELALRAAERAHAVALEKHTERTRSLADAERAAVIQQAGLASAEADVIARARQLERQSHFFQTKADIRLLLNQPLPDAAATPAAHASPTPGGLIRSRPHTASPTLRHTVGVIRPYTADAVRGKDTGLFRLAPSTRKALGFHEELLEGT